MQKELTTLSFAFGPSGRFVLHMPMTHDRLLNFGEHFLHSLISASVSCPDFGKSAEPANKQLEFVFEPICSAVKQPKFAGVSS
jgi:hypothetical protein